MNTEELKKQIRECDRKKPFLFVSYSKADSERVYPIVIKLQEAGYNIWIDKELTKRAGEDWQKYALGAIHAPKCKALLLFISENSMASAPVFAELMHSKSNKVKKNNGGEELKIIPVNVSENWSPKETNLQDWLRKDVSALWEEEVLETDDFDVMKGIVPGKYLDGEEKLDNHGEIPGTIYEEIFEQNGGNKMTLIMNGEMGTIIENIPKEVCCSAEENNEVTSEEENNDAPVKEEEPCIDEEKSVKKPYSVTGDITFTLYGKEFTCNQSDMMLTFFAQVLKRHSDKVEELPEFRGMNCASSVDYSKNENKKDMPSYFRVCAYFTFDNGASVCIGTAYSLQDKLKKMASLLAICEESEDVFQSEQITLPQVKSVGKGTRTRGGGKSDSLTYRIYGNEYEGNQSEMLETACYEVLSRHTDLLEKAADELNCISLSDLSGVSNDNKPVYFRVMKVFEIAGRPVSVGASYGMTDKLKLVSRLLKLCDEPEDVFEVEGYELPESGKRRGRTANKSADMYLNV